MILDSSFSKIYYEENSNFVEIRGVSNLSINRQFSFENPYMLGGIRSPSQINSPTQLELSFDRDFYECDGLFKYTGSSAVKSFYITNGVDFYKINNSYLTSYSTSFSVGEPPKINTKFSSFSEKISIDKNFYQPYGIINNTIFIPKLTSISLNLLNNSANQVIKKDNIYSFNYNMTIKRQPYYSVGGYLPTEVCPLLPLEITSSISCKNTQNFDSNEDLLKLSTTPDLIDFDIKINDDLNGNTLLATFPIRNAHLVSKDRSIKSSSSMEITNNFLGYYGL